MYLDANIIKKAYSARPDLDNDNGEASSSLAFSKVSVTPEKNDASSERRAATNNSIGHEIAFPEGNVSHDETFAENCEENSSGVQGGGADWGCITPKASPRNSGGQRSNPRRTGNRGPISIGVRGA